MQSRHEVNGRGGLGLTNQRDNWESGKRGSKKGTGEQRNGPMHESNQKKQIRWRRKQKKIKDQQAVHCNATSGCKYKKDAGEAGAKNKKKRRKGKNEERGRKKTRATFYEARATTSPPPRQDAPKQENKGTRKRQGGKKGMSQKTTGLGEEEQDSVRDQQSTKNHAKQGTEKQETEKLRNPAEKEATGQTPRCIATGAAPVDPLPQSEGKKKGVIPSHKLKKRPRDSAEAKR